MPRGAAVRAVHGAVEKGSGKEVGKVEEDTRNPFPWSIWVEENRRSGSTRRGGARAALPWRLAIGPSIPTGGSSSKAHGGAVEVRDMVGKFHVEGIDERRPEMAGAPSEASTARLGTS